MGYLTFFSLSIFLLGVTVSFSLSSFPTGFTAVSLSTPATVADIKNAAASFTLDFF